MSQLRRESATGRSSVIFRRYTLLIASSFLGIMSIVFGLLFFFYKNQEFYYISIFASVAFILMLGGTTLFGYLGDDLPAGYFSAPARPHEDMDAVRARITQLELSVSESRLQGGNAIDPAKITQDVQTFVKGQIETALLRKIEIRFDKQFRDETFFKNVQTRLENLSASLATQLRLQDRKANLNLIIGIMIAMTGFGILGYLTVRGYVDLGKDGKITSLDISEFVIWYVPKLTFVLVVEVFSYFFLNLYRSGLGEIKYFQNEITGLESRIAALYAARAGTDLDTLRGTIDRLANTERNVVLKTGERAISEATIGEAKSEIAGIVSKALDSYFQAMKPK